MIGTIESGVTFRIEACDTNKNVNFRACFTFLKEYLLRNGNSMSNILVQINKKEKNYKLMYNNDHYQFFSN